ncbi:nucleoside-diphosphate sugar epimerase/dehydratase [uncultured Clostridium sp.]|uniref:polysaccharide biosynthesis protein n=1 Tax=uncultured Clostridium sp. TaxID=59620 RepID=UPI0025E12DC6|nr:nucleoside-diphosphate sugar epimerase/dehydratase [uncultured Clostridium sp.]
MKRWKTLIIMMIDIFMVNMAYLFSINIVKGEDFTEIAKIYSHDVIALSLIYIVCFYLFKMYESLWHLTGTDEFLLGVGGNISAGILSIAYTRSPLGSTIPLNVMVVGILLSIFFVLGYRILYRVYRRTLLYIPFKYSADQRRVMIVGAGSAGTMIINEMMARRELKYNPIVLIDDDKDKLGKRISGVKIEGNRYDIPYIVGEQEIDLIVIAIPSIDAKNKAEIIEICKNTNCKLQIIPGMYEILSGEATVSRIKDVDVEDLLGRDPIQLDNQGIEEYIKGRTILVTGAGGSIGSELCRQIAAFQPKRLILFDIYENNVYDIQNELKEDFPDMNMSVLIGSIRDRERLHEVFGKYKIDVVFHAAAHKHVPLMEDSPKEAIKNNVFGTLNLALEASAANVSRFVMISTDKAVNPTNIMGASKRLCEMIVQAMDKQSKTEFVAVRFGNVLGSNGSVIPLFKKQIAHGGPVTVTHKKIIRYFMLIPEAAQLVLQAGAFAKGGEIFVLDMGKPVKIYDLACDLIRLSGLEPNKDIKIVFTGLRPGEKLYEELLMSEEGLQDTVHKKIYVGKPTFEDMDKLTVKLEQLKKLLQMDNIDEIKHQMQIIVPTYHYKNEDEVAAENADKE